MSRSSMGDPEKFELAKHGDEEQPQYWMGITSNRRLLVVKAGHLYYSNIPKSFTDASLPTRRQH